MTIDIEAPGANAAALMAALRAAAGIEYRGASVTRSANLTSQNLTSFLSIPFDSEVIDTDGLHANSPNPDRLTIPAALDGAIVMVTGGVYYTGGTGSLSCQVFLGHKNSGGSTLHGGRVFSYASVSGGGSAVLVTTVSASDYFYLSLSDGATTDATIYATNTHLDLTVIGLNPA